MSNLFLDALTVKAPVQRAVASPRPPYRPLPQTQPVAVPVHPLADQIDAMVADMVASGAVYLDGDTYKTRKRAWRFAS